jgi:DNA-binding sugar fermentation-stimulating protein
MIEYIEAIFLREEKTRFLCTVLLDGKEELCYVPSSCKLGSLIKLEGELVWLRPIERKSSKMRYSLYAVKKRQGWVLLNLAEVNNVIRSQITRRVFSYLGARKEIQTEKMIEGYKADLFLPESNTVIEVKTVLTEDRMGYFSILQAGRTEKQLKQLRELLEKKYKVCYLIVALNPKTKEITVTEDLKELFEQCVAEGMQCYGYTLKLIEGNPVICKKISINL